MKEKNKALILPLAIIAVGLGWLLTALEITPEIDWIWTLALAAIGGLAFVACGVDRFTVVFGPFFLVASVLSVLRQMGQLQLKTEVPILMIVFGVLQLFATLKGFPPPAWLTGPPSSDTSPAGGRNH
jgi:hypothetical protein